MGTLLLCFMIGIVVLGPIGVVMSQHFIDDEIKSIISLERGKNGIGS